MHLEDQPYKLRKYLMNISEIKYIVYQIPLIPNLPEKIKLCNMKRNHRFITKRTAYTPMKINIKPLLLIKTEN